MLALMQIIEHDNDNDSDGDGDGGSEKREDKVLWFFGIEPYGMELAREPHIVRLADGHRDAYYVLLDTERGVITWGS